MVEYIVRPQRCQARWPATGRLYYGGPSFQLREGLFTAKGYWIGRVDISDTEAYQEYVKASAAAFSKYGARFIVRGGAFEAREGTSRSRNVVIEFPDYQSALDCYDSPEYRHALSFRESAANADIIIIEGYDGPQPCD